MKKAYKTLIAIGTALITFFACTKEMDIQFSFPFEIIKEHKEIATINYKEPTKIQIVPERIVKDNVYRFKYTIADGDGSLSYKGREPLPENTWETCGQFEMDLEFIGTALDECKVEFTVKDMEGLTETIHLNYDVVHNPFKMDVNSTTTALVIGKDAPVIYRLENTGKDSSVTYESLIRFKKGSGSLYKTNDIGESTFKIEPDAYFPIQEGSQFYNLVLDAVGEHTILFQTKDSNGQLKEAELSFNADIIDFTYIGAPQRNALFVGESTNLNFEINELLDGGDVYQSRYEINSGNATLKRTFENIGEIVSPGVNYPVGANAYYWELEALEAGTVDITFFAKNASGTEKQLNITIEVSNGVFDFKATNSGNFAAVNDDVPVNFLITETGPQGSPYTMIFESSSNGVLEIGGTAYAQGEPIPIERSNFIGNYKGLIRGKHDVLFTVTNTLNEVKEDGFSITFNEESFMFTAIAEDTNIYVNAGTNINLNITDGSDGATYRMYYTVSGSGKSSLTSGNTQFNAGAFYDVLNGPFSWDFNALSEGNVTYTFYIANNSGHIQHQEVEFVILPKPINDFTFTAIGSANSETTGRQVPVNMNITETSGNSEYSMVFTTTGTGTLSYNGVNYSQGDPITVTPGNLTASYLGSTAGIHDITFTATNANTVPISRSDAISITYHNVDFNLSVSGDSSLYAGTSEDFNVHLSQVQNDPLTTYSVAYNIAASSVGNGEISTSSNTPVTLGQPYSIDMGTTAMNFTATGIGLTIIDISVTDSNDISHTSQVTFDVQDIDFTFSGAPQQNTIEVGQTTSLNFNINEAVTSGAAYQMKYEILSGIGNIKHGSTTQAVNTYYNVNTGNYSWEFEAISSGTVELLFTALNSTTNVTHTQTITITVNEPPMSDFTFTSIPSANNATVGESVPVNFNITETVGNSTYFMVFTSSGNGTFDYNGISYVQGEPINVTPGNFTGTYIGSDSETHDINFTVTNANDIPLSHSDDIAIRFDNIDFNLSTSGDSSLYVGTSEDFSVHLSQAQNDPSITYSVAYNIAASSVGNGEISTSSNTPVTLGQPYSIDMGTTAMNFTATVIGLTIIDVTVTDSNNQSYTSQVTFDVQDIDFTFSGAPQQNEIEVGQTTNLNFNIHEAVASGATYQMKYEIVSGSGNVKDGSTTQSVNTYYNVNTGNYSWEFEATTSSGPVELLFTALNTTTNVTHSQTVTITVNEPPVSDFTFRAIASANIATVGESVLMHFNITETVGNSNYSMVFTTSSSATFIYNGVEYNQGQSIPVSSGNFTGTYKSSTAAEHDILFTVTNTNDVPISHSDDIAITYYLLEFEFSGASQQNTIKTGESTFLNFNISETFVSGNNYEMKYEIINGNGKVKDGGLVRSVNTYFNVNTGSYSWKFEGTESGTVELLFTAQNTTTNVTHTQTIEIIVTDPPVGQFTFTAIPSANDGTVGQSVPINFNITETVGNSTYSMVFTSNGTGTLDYNGTSYNQGQPISVSPGSFTGAYTGTSSGSHDITFTVTNTNDTPISKSDNISINYDSIDFTLSTVGDGSLFLNSQKDFYAIISQESNDNSITYRVRFSITSGSTGNGQIKTAENNTTIPLGSYRDGIVDVGSTSFLFEGNSQGTVNILVEVMDSDNRYKSSTISFTIDNVPFTFDAAAQDGSIEIGESTNIFLNISEPTQSFTNYEVKYQITSSKTAQISYNGTSIDPNTYRPINTGSTPWIFSGTEEGKIKVMFTVRNKNTLSMRSKTVEIEVNKIPSQFNFTAIPTVNSAKVNDCTDINITLSETVGTSTYTMVFTSSESGTVNYNGTTYSQGQPITVSPGNFVVCYTGTNDGLEHDVKFTITNSESLSKDKTFEVFIESINDFVFLGSTTSSSVTVNDNVGVNFNLNELVGNSTYSVVFTTDGSGTFVYKGNTYTNGQTIPSFSTGLSGGIYYPTSEGNHLIRFIASNSEAPKLSRTYQRLLNVSPSCKVPLKRSVHKYTFF